jgi:hypothetical protein
VRLDIGHGRAQYPPVTPELEAPLSDQRATLAHSWTSAGP